MRVSLSTGGLGVRPSTLSALSMVPGGGGDGKGLSRFGLRRMEFPGDVGASEEEVGGELKLLEVC